jgi:hypothetical protein
MLRLVLICVSALSCALALGGWVLITNGREDPIAEALASEIEDANYAGELPLTTIEHREGFCRY